jgi:hypothetical protein
LYPLLYLVRWNCGAAFPNSAVIFSCSPPPGHINITPIPASAPASTPEPTPTSQPDSAASLIDFVGVWEHPSPGASVFRDIKEDGKIILTSGEIENLAEQPCSTSESWFEGNRFMVEIIDTAINKECIGMVGIYEVQLLADGSLHLIAIENEYDIRIRANQAGNWVPAQ